MVRLAAIDTATPLAVGILRVVELGHHVVLEGLQFRLVLRRNAGDSGAGGGLLTDESTESGLGLDDAVWDIHLSAESRHPANNFDGIDIVSDDDQVGLLGFDELSHMVQ